MGTANQPKAKHATLSAEEFEKLRLTQGRPPFGVELRIVDESTNKVLANDGHTQGNLQFVAFGLSIIISIKKKVPPQPMVGSTRGYRDLDADGYIPFATVPKT